MQNRKFIVSNSIPVVFCERNIKNPLAGLNYNQAGNYQVSRDVVPLQVRKSFTLYNKVRVEGRYVFAFKLKSYRIQDFAL